MRENRTSGSESGDWKRPGNKGAGPEARSESDSNSQLSLQDVFSPHFSPGRWNHDEKQFIFSTLIGPM